MKVTTTVSEEEWEAGYAAYGEELRGFVEARVEAEEADDLLQEVWSAYAETLRTTIVAQPRAWLYRVARNRITDRYRRTAGRPAFVDLTPDADRADDDYPAPDPEVTRIAILAALTELPPAQREVFERNELDGETLREIAADLGLPLKTVISRKGYARRRLQSLLHDLYNEYFFTD